jgi:hypothetical protein
MTRSWEESSSGHPPSDVAERLQRMVGQWRWSPRSAFPQSNVLNGELFSCGGGLYLMTNSRRGSDDPVWAVGWAESDYWARRVWEKKPPFPGDLNPPPPQWRPPPSLEFLGRPGRLAFAAVLRFERARANLARRAALADVTFRFTDGGILYYNVNGTDGITYKFASSDPKPDDEPVAIEFRLPQRKPSSPDPT